MQIFDYLECVLLGFVYGLVAAKILRKRPVITPLPAWTFETALGRVWYEATTVESYYGPTKAFIDEINRRVQESALPPNA